MLTWLKKKKKETSPMVLSTNEEEGTWNHGIDSVVIVSVTK